LNTLFVIINSFLLQHPQLKAFAASGDSIPVVAKLAVLFVVFFVLRNPLFLFLRILLTAIYAFALWGLSHSWGEYYNVEKNVIIGGWLSAVIYLAYCLV
jgi:hypothetical protein